MRTATRLLAASILSLAALPVAWAAEGDGLQPRAETMPWARGWQGRFSLDTAAAWQPAAGTGDTRLAGISGLSLMGDYYFANRARGFRATSGLIVGGSTLWAPVPARNASGLAFSIDRRLFGTPAALAANDASADAMPYLGLGYTGLSARRAWSFSADLGLVALAPGQAVKLGRVFSGAQSLDDLVRDLRLAPVLQLGVSYSF